MSYVSSLINQNRSVNISGLTVPSQVGASTVYLSLYQCPAQFLVTTINIQASSNVTGNITVNLVTDGAAWRAAGSAAAKQVLTQYSTPPTALVNQASLFNVNAYRDDPYGIGLMQIVIQGSAAFSTGTVFTVTITGHSQEGNMRIEGTMFNSDPYMRVLSVTSAGVVTDLSDAARTGTLGGYGLDAVDKGYSFTALKTATDKLYIGTINPIPKLLFLVPVYAQQTSAPLYEVWTGSAWATATVLDGTSDGQATASGMSYSGILIVPAQTNVAQHLTIDPLSVFEDSIKAGFGQGANMLYNPNKYWLRVSFAALPTPLKLAAVKQVK